MGTHSGKVAFRFDGSHPILEKWLCGTAYSKSVYFFGEHTLVIFHFPTTDDVTLLLVTSEFLELFSLWSTSRPRFYRVS